MNSPALLLCFVYLVPGCLAVIKTWFISTKFEDSHNWSPVLKDPCKRDTLVFPEDSVASLSTSLLFQKLVLPLSGEILLNEGAAFEYDNTEECQGKEYHFIEGKKHHWWRPQNWMTDFLGLIVGALKSSQVIYHDIVAHTNHVPCAFDDVLIPNETNFNMILEGKINVKSLTIAGKKMDSEGFESFARSSDGRRLVEGDFQLTVDGNQGELCEDPTGCVCSNNQNTEKYLLICEAFGACEFPLCKDPIKPDGFCCPFCCSIVDFEYENGFQLGYLMNKLEEMLKEVSVSCYVSKRRNGLIQGVCVDNADKRNSIARRFLETAKQQLLQDPNLHVTKVRTLHSLQWLADQPPTSNTDVGLVVGLLFFFLLLAAAAVTAYYFYKKKRLPDFNFVRFDRRERAKVEVELGTTPHDELQPQDEPSSKRVFYNPVYGKEPSSSKVERRPDPGENPLYGLDDDVVEA